MYGKNASSAQTALSREGVGNRTGKFGFSPVL
jgi:hypothetical protein